MLYLKDILRAHTRLNGHVHRTPVVSSDVLNSALGHRIFFKLECMQKIGAFKARGAFNAIASAIERSQAPQLVICNSSGNHAQAVAWAAKLHGLPSLVYMPSNVSKVKLQATRAAGAEVVLCADRAEADQRVSKHATQEGVLWIPPFNSNDVIAGQGTAALEAIEQLADRGVVPDAVVAPCGGGGLLAGTFVASKGLLQNCDVIGVEPEQANDAARSLKLGRIVKLDESPITLADGAMPLAVGDLTFPYLKQLDYFYEASEEAIAYWTQWLSHLLKVHAEPTSCMGMMGAVRYLNEQNDSKSVLVILSGGNIDHEMMKKLWQRDHLMEPPALQSTY